MDDGSYPVTSGHLVVRRGGARYVVKDMENKATGFANEALKNMLLLCDGTKTVDELVDEIAELYKEERPGVKERVNRTLDYLAAIGVLGVSDVPKPTSITVREQHLEWPLDTVYIETTNACNLECIHCYADAEGGLEKEMSTGELLGLIDTLADLGVLNVVLTGGEPMLRPDIFGLMEHIVKREMSFNLFTNAVLLDEKKVARLKELGPEMVAVSLDGGSAETYRKIRGSDTFDKVVESIRMLADAGLVVRINSTVYTDNIHEAEELLELSTGIGAHQITFDRFMDFGRGAAHTELMPPIDASRDIAFRLSKRTEQMMRGKRMELPSVSVDDHFQTKRDEAAPKYSSCGIGTSQLTIRANGDVVLCPVLSGGEHVAGNVLKESIKAIWEGSPVFAPLRNHTVEDIPECLECKYHDDCRGGCKARCLKLAGRFDAPDPWKCGYYKGLEDWAEHLKGQEP